MGANTHEGVTYVSDYFTLLETLLDPPKMIHHIIPFEALFQYGVIQEWIVRFPRLSKRLIFPKKMFFSMISHSRKYRIEK